VCALHNMPATEAVDEDTDGVGVDGADLEACGKNDPMLLKNWSVRPILLPRPSVATARLSHIGRLVKVEIRGIFFLKNVPWRRAYPLAETRR